MKRLLITDVDNTLLDWQNLWFETFSAMSRKALQISGVDAGQFYAECSALHQKHGTSEYAFVLTELPCLKSLYGDDVLEAMQPAVDEFRETRRKHLALYPGVAATLDRLRDMGVVIAAFTESKAFYTNYRFRKLGLDSQIDYLYSPADHEIPDDAVANRKYESSTYDLKHTQHRYTPEGEVKPNPHILSCIVEELGFSTDETIYVGDNLLKDVLMAQQAGITDVYAAYGASQHRAEQYDLLKKVTHWTPEMVAREQAALNPGSVTPTHNLKHSFGEIVELVTGE